MAKLGEITIKTNSTAKRVPVFPPGEVSNSALRVGMPGGTIGAIPLMSLDGATDSSFRVRTPDGTKTVGSLITLEDFEHGYPNPSNASGMWQPAATDVANLTTSPALEGAHSLALNRWHAITRPDITTPREGAEYLVRVQASSGVPTLFICSQNRDVPLRNCYAVHMNTLYDTWFGIKKYVNSNQHILNVTYNFAGGEEIVKNQPYVIGVEPSQNKIRARLYKMDGTVLADVTATDTTYSGGTLGLYGGGSSGVDYFDLIQKRIY